MDIIEKKYKIIEIIEEKDKFYIVINKDEDLISKIDKLLLTDELNFQDEGKIEGHGIQLLKMKY